MSGQLILAGDVGGTKTNMALFSHARGPLDLIRMQRFSTQEAASLESIVDQFLGGDKGKVNVCRMSVQVSSTKTATSNFE